MFFIVRIQIPKVVGRRHSSHFLAENLFNEENIRNTVSKFAKFRPIKSTSTRAHDKTAAVLIPLCVVDGKVSLLYTLRSSNLKSHRGQVSFPGGMRDSTDRTVEETALRETEEELGIKREAFKIWGKGNVISGRGEICIFPVIGQLKPNLIINKLQLNPNEVSDVFSVSLRDLCNPKKCGHTQFKDLYSLPVYGGGKRRIWGLTAMITFVFLKALLPETVFNHKLKYINSISPNKK